MLRFFSLRSAPGAALLRPTTQQTCPASAWDTWVYFSPEYSRISAAFSAQRISPVSLRRLSRSRTRRTPPVTFKKLSLAPALSLATLYTRAANSAGYSLAGSKSHRASISSLTPSLRRAEPKYTGNSRR